MKRIDNSGKGIAGLGRGEDSMIAHVAPGEMVVPPVISETTQDKIKQEMIAVGLDPNEYTVGQGMSINPITGMAEFGFLKKLGKSLKKVVKKVAPIAGALLIPGVGGALGKGLGAIGSKLGIKAGIGSKLLGGKGILDTAAAVRGGIGGLFGMGGGQPTEQTIQQGDTLYSISQSTGVPLQEIMDANPGIDPKALVIGDTIAIPGVNTPNIFRQVLGSTPGQSKIGVIEDMIKGKESDFTKERGEASGGLRGMTDNAGLMALAALYGKAVKEDFKKKEGGLKDIRQSIRPDLMPAPTFTGFDLGIRPGMAEGGEILDPNDLPNDVKTKLENIYRKLYLANPEKGRNLRYPAFSLLTEDEEELYNQYFDGRLRRDAPLVAKYMDLIGFDNLADDNPLLGSTKFLSTGLGIAGSIPVSRIRRRLNPEAGILSNPVKDKVLAERKEKFGYAEGGLMDNELDMRMGGPSIGPGTGTSDDIPAMLSDGEFVMTSAANNGLGGFKITKSETGIEIMPSGKPDRQKGAKNMDRLMKMFEQYNDIGKV
tara:strand:+ start:3585 stop:5204 length:1620 start_codon:yes stop_codon:yes gene_type:complete